MAKKTAPKEAATAPASETPAKADAAAKPAKAPAARKPPAPKKPAAPKGKSAAKAGGPPATPLIDTGLAAQTAARLIAAKGAASGAAPAAAGDAAKRETSTFKQLKETLSKGHSQSVHSVLNSSMSPAAKKGNLPFFGGKQTGHNQTFGSDASKNFVPRRTGG